MVTIQFTDFGFAGSYEVDINPEYPAAGEWEVPNFLFGGRSKDTLTIRIRPHLTKPWVAGVDPLSWTPDGLTAIATIITSLVAA